MGGRVGFGFGVGLALGEKVEAVLISLKVLDRNGKEGRRKPFLFQFRGNLMMGSPNSNKQCRHRPSFARCTRSKFARLSRETRLRRPPVCKVWNNVIILGAKTSETLHRRAAFLQHALRAPAPLEKRQHCFIGFSVAPMIALSNTWLSEELSSIN